MVGSVRGLQPIGTLPLFTIAYTAVALPFAVAALAVMGFAVMELWEAVVPRDGQALAVRAGTVIESIGLLAVALVGLEMAQTIVEEEMVRRVHVSAPTRVRRYLSLAFSWSSSSPWRLRASWLWYRRSTSGPKLSRSLTVQVTAE